MARRLSPKRGQLLAYVYWYTKLHRIPPSENEIAAFVGVRGPSVHRMILDLEAAGHISRIPGQPRTIRVLLPREELPELE
ncbi:MAG: LexA family protein [Thermoplasmata archaeon]